MTSWSPQVAETKRAQLAEAIDRMIDADVLQMLQFALKLSMEQGAIDAARHLLTILSDEPTLDTVDMLKSAMLGGQAMLELVLDHTPTLESDEIFHVLIASRTALRDDEDLVELISEEPPLSRYSAHLVDYESEVMMDTLVRHDIIDLSNLGWNHELRIMCWGLQAHIRDRVLGYNILYGPDSDLPSKLEGPSLYTDVLLYLIFKRPSSAELLDWMIEHNDDFLLAEAARCVLDNELASELDIQPYCTLFTALLYPSMTVNELRSELEEQEVDAETIRSSLALVGACIGAVGIQARVI
ncbi:Hypothetical protein POVR2_LOCUS15 [uncultured virus]|nr:Hypothetical protein POVR2_LOCUS15 [uncultured virus]